MAEQRCHKVQTGDVLCLPEEARPSHSLRSLVALQTRCCRAFGTLMQGLTTHAEAHLPLG